MKDQELNARLHRRVPVTPPRPGFEARLRATARESLESSETRRPSLLPVWSALALVLVLFLTLLWQFRPREEKAPVTRLPKFKPVSTARFREPVRNEYDALRNEARFSLSLVRGTLPSLPLPQEKQDQDDKEETSARSPAQDHQGPDKR